jgi:hypothetical protein
MIIYHYHPETKQYITSGLADPSPLEKGVYLIPAHSTNIQPPTSIEGKIITFDVINNKWVQIIPEFIPQNDNEKLPVTNDEKKVKLRQVRNNLLNQADIIYCNPDKWELMTDLQKQAWRTYKRKLRNWEDVNLDEGTFPNIPEC